MTTKNVIRHFEGNIVYPADVNVLVILMWILRAVPVILKWSPQGVAKNLVSTWRPDPSG